MNRIGNLLVATALVTVAACQEAPQSIPKSAVDIDSSFELVDETGENVTSEKYSGTVRLVFFGYTSCPDICPVTLQNISMALNSMGSLAEQVTVLFVSVDPKRDTPERLRQYTDAFHPSIVGLTGTYRQIAEVTEGFRTTFGYSLTEDNGHERPLSENEYETIAETASYVPYHSSQVYVIGENNELLDIIGYGSKPQQIEEALRTHLGSPDG